MLRSRTAVCLALFALAAAAVAGCNKDSPDAKGKSMPPPQVAVAKPVEWLVQSYREYNGFLEAVEMVQVKARVKGILEQIHFTEGEEVKEGAPLYTIDPREYKAAVAKGVADVAKATADIDNWKAQIKRDEAELDRAKRQSAAGAGSPSDVEKAAAAVDVDRAQLDVAKATKAASEAMLDTARLELGYTEIAAPITGRISRTMVTRGNLVGQNETTLLTTIVRMHPVYVYFDAPEPDVIDYQRWVWSMFRSGGVIPRISETKFPLEVGVATERGFPHPGVINFRENRVDTGTGTVRVRGELANEDRFLYPGLFARVRVPNGDPRTRLSIPEAALMAGQEGRFVYVVNAADTVEKRLVTVAARLEESRPGQPAAGWKLVGPGPAERPINSMVAIDKGLNPGDRVVVDGLQRARPGAPAAPAQWTITPPPGAPKPAHGPVIPTQPAAGPDPTPPPGEKK
jgi:RND family efflux transporter MFP subunit